jgi:hypothetical protein
MGVHVCADTVHAADLGKLVKPSELTCLSYLDSLDGGHGVVPDGCDIAQLEAEGLIQLGDSGHYVLTPAGKLQLANLRTLERQFRRSL